MLPRQPASGEIKLPVCVSLVLAASQLTPLTGRFDLGLSRPNPKPGLLCQPPLTGEKGISEGQFGEGQASPCAQLALKHGCWMQGRCPVLLCSGDGWEIGGGRVGVLAETQSVQTVPIARRILYFMPSWAPSLHHR